MDGIEEMTIAVRGRNGAREPSQRRGRNGVRCIHDLSCGEVRKADPHHSPHRQLVTAPIVYPALEPMAAMYNNQTPAVGAY